VGFSPLFSYDINSSFTVLEICFSYDRRRGLFDLLSDPPKLLFLKSIDGNLGVAVGEII